MQAEITIRPLTAADYSAVLNLWKSSEGVEVAEGDDKASFCAYLERNPGLSPCAEVAGAIVGAALCGHDGRRGLIYHITVAREFRGRGIGKELMAKCLAGLRPHGITRALVLVGGDNPSAQCFWRAMGFSEISNALPLGRDIV